MRKRLLILIATFSFGYSDVAQLPQGIGYDETVSIAVSPEIIHSFEKSNHSKVSFLPWYGLAYLLGVYPDVINTAGFEFALGGRFYPLSINHDGLFLGGYSGGSMMVSVSDDPFYFGFVIGVKSGYKFVTEAREKRKRVIEPYASYSISPYDFGWRKANKNFLNTGLITIGVRFVIERYKVHYKNQIEVESVP